MKKQITDLGAIQIMKIAYKVALSVIARARRVSDTKAAAKFDDMTAQIMRERAAYLEIIDGGTYRAPSTDCGDGDGLQVVRIAYETLCNIALTDGAYADCVSCDVWAHMRGRRFTENRYGRGKDVIHTMRLENIAPYQIAYRKCSAYISEHAAPDTRRQKETYLEDMAQYDIDGVTWEEIVYHKCPYLHSADFETEETVRENRALAAFLDIFKSELTATQAAVLEYRAHGYGYKYIAAKRGVTPRAIAKTVQQIAKKFIDFVKPDSELYILFIGQLVSDECSTERPANIRDSACYADTVKYDEKARKTERKKHVTPAAKNAGMSAPDNTYTTKEWRFAAAFDNYF